VDGEHWILAVVELSSSTIHIYDSDPSEDGGAMYLDAIEMYLTMEYEKTDQKIPEPKWKKKPCRKGDKHVPKQAKKSFDCGVFVCLFMDLVMSNCSVQLFSKKTIKKYGRDWLCLSLVEKKIMF
jgi:Ulp1 family protease